MSSKSMLFSFANYILALRSSLAQSIALPTSKTLVGVFSPGPVLSNSARSLTDAVKGILRILHLPLATTMHGDYPNTQLIIGI